MALARQQARGRVEPDPARPRQIDLAPSVQIGEIGHGAGRAIHGLDVGAELDQVARDEARRQPQVAQHLHQQPTAVAAGAAAQAQRLLGALDAGFEPDGVAYVALHFLVEGDQKIQCAQRLALDPVEVGLQQRRGRRMRQVGCQFGAQAAGVGKGHLLGIGFEEKIEGVVHRHFQQQFNRDLELARGLLKHQPGLVVGKRVLLPVDEVRGGLDALRVGQHLGATVWGRTQAHHLRAQVDQAVVAVVRGVAEGNLDRHGVLSLERCCARGIAECGALEPCKDCASLCPRRAKLAAAAG